MRIAGRFDRTVAGIVVGALALAFLVLLPRYGTWGAKRWCEELAQRMEEDRAELEADSLHMRTLQEEIGWYPTLLQGAHSLGWSFGDEGVRLTFSTSSGSHSYDSASDTWTSGGPIQTAEVFLGD